MFICHDCGNIFEEPSSYKECIGEFWGSPAYETFSCCPICRSDDIGEKDEDDV